MTAQRSAKARTVTVCAAAWLFASTGAVVSESPRIAGFCLGALFPGGGLTYYGHWLEFGLVLMTAAWLAMARRFGPLALLWASVAAIELTHDPHPGEAWDAARWAVPALSVCLLVALLTRAGVKRPERGTEIVYRGVSS